MIRYNPRGLSPNEVAESRRQHGDNVITVSYTHLTLPTNREV